MAERSIVLSNETEVIYSDAVTRVKITFRSGDEEKFEYTDIKQLAEFLHAYLNNK